MRDPIPVRTLADGGQSADDIVFARSFNPFRSGEMNTENVLDIRDAALAERMAAFVDGICARYPDVAPPAFAESGAASSSTH